MKKEIANRFHIFGLEYFQQDLPLEKQFHLDQVDLFEVSQSASESNNGPYLSPRKLFAKAGLKSILAVIQDITGPSNLNSVFFEFIKLTASPGEFQQLNFNCYWSKSKKEGIINKDRVDKNFRRINELLTRNKLSIYNHQGFFALPKNPTAYASWHEDIHKILNTENKEIKKIKNKLNNQWKNHFRKFPKDLKLEKVKTVQPGGYLWLKNRPAENMTYGKYLEESYNAKIPISDELRIQLGIRPEERGIRFLHALTHACFNYRFLDKKNWEQNTLFLSIPLLAPITNKREKKTWKHDTVNYLGQGAIFIFLKLDKKISDQKLKTLIGAIANLGKDLTYNYLLEVGLKQAEVLSKHALRSAFAGILSRNGSHNLGSHVLSSLPGGFQDLQDLHNLINYVQERFDYLALVTTDFPVWTYPVYFVNDIVHRFMKQRLLLKYLAETENIGPYEYQRRELKGPYNFEYEYKEYSEDFLKKQKGKLVFYISYFKEGLKEPIEIVTPLNKQKDILQDILIAIPGGIVGYHAIFMILENIIRNSAKYGFGNYRDTYPDNLEIHIELEEFEEDFVEVRIWDNVSLDLEMDKPLHEIINERLTSPFIDPNTGGIINESLGLAEMRIAAGFLNIRKRSSIGSNDKNKILYKRSNYRNNRLNKKGPIEKGYSGFIRAFQKRNPKTQEVYLGYKFPLPKPKDIWMMGNYPQKVKDLIIKTKNKNRVYQEGETGKDKKFQDSDFVVIYEEGKGPENIVTYRVENIVELKEKFEKSRQKLISYIHSLEEIPILFSDELFEAHNLSRIDRINLGVQLRIYPLELKRRFLKQNPAKAQNIDSAETQEISNLIQTYLEEILELNYKEKYEKLMLDLLELLDDYPGRIVVVSDQIIAYKNSGRFPEILQKRMVSVSREEFQEQLENDEDLYLYLYRRWIDHIKFLRYRHNRNEYKIDLRILTDFIPSSLGVELFEQVFAEYREIIAYSITPGGFKRDGKQRPPALDYHYSIHKKHPDLFNSLLINIPFHKIKEVMSKKDLKWAEDVFVEKWVDVALLNLDLGENEDNIKIEIIDQLLVLFRHYFFASKKFYNKYQEGIETLPLIFKSNDLNEINGSSANPSSDDQVMHTESLNKFLKIVNYEHNKYTSKKTQDNSPTQLICYQRHKLLDEDEKNKEIIYNEALSGSQIFFSLLKNLPKDDYDRNRLFFQMVENGLLRMAIFDERLYKYCKQKEGVRKRLNKGNVSVPYSLHYKDRVFNMENLRMVKGVNIGDEEIAFFESEVKKEELKHLKLKQLSLISEVDVLIIHQGILDKLFPQRSSKTQKGEGIDPLNRFIHRCKLKTPYVVVTSGRGEPSSLPDKTKFIPYSNLQTMFMQEYPEKLLFTQILMKVSTTQKSIN